MSQPLEHSFQILRTEFTAEKDNCDLDGINLQLLDSTCLYNYPMNRNNVLGGNNLIYLNGSYITFYNFFQNNKQFGSAVSPYRPIGMVSNSVGRGNVAVVTQNPAKTEMHISVYSFCEQYVPNHIIKKQLHFIDIVMIRATYIVIAVHDPTTSEYIVYIFNSKIVYSINLHQWAIKRLVCQDDRIHALFQTGGMHLLDHEKIVEKADIEIEHSDKNIDDYCEIDNQAKILLYSGTRLYCYWFESQKEYALDFSQHVGTNHNNEPCRAHRIIKVGRNILVAHRNALCISHFVLGDDNVVFVGNHAYQERFRGGIVSIQSSQDQMHAALAVEVFEKEEIKIENFIFNLSSISKNHKFINPFTRLMANGSDCGLFNTMENVLSCNSYLLIGSKIYNLCYSSTLQRRKSYNLYQTPKFMTVHPFGHQFLCGFDNIIKFYNKIEKQMQEIWSQQYICTAAKYSKSGGLVLSCIEDSYTTLILYDCYNFRKLKNIPISFMKIYPIKIDWLLNNSHIVLYTNNEILKINVFTGEKVTEFKQKDRVKEKEKDRKDFAIRCIDYDGYSDRAIFATNASTGNLVIVSKSQPCSHSLNHFRSINFPQEISCIKISQSLKTIFLGCKSGTLYWCPYPVKIKTIIEQSQPTANILTQLQKLKLHSQPITSIDHTSNNKFMIVSVRGQGYFSFRVRKVKSKDSVVNMNIVFQELGNPILNTIETSSTINYANNKEKLKISLEKRKECFNDLEEFRREWQVKSAMTSKQIQIQGKKNELAFINDSLTKIEQIKQKKKAIQLKINHIITQIEGKKQAKEQSYAKEMLQLYKEQEQQMAVLEEKKKMYNQEYEGLERECQANLKEIQKEMIRKREYFHNNYLAMLGNLEKFQKRYRYEKEQQPLEQQLQIKEHLKNLQITEMELTKMSNDLSVKIAQCKKHYQRYCSRKSFLEYKNLFFKDENMKCNQEKTKLLDLKQKLELQLKQLQVYTDKKQKKLRVYLKSNQALRKYKQIHENLSENAVRQAEFIKTQQVKVDNDIVAIQKELSGVASSNEAADKEIEKLEGKIEQLKRENVQLNMKMKDIGYYLKEILAAMEEVGYCNSQEEREQKLKKIYNYFYVERSVEYLIERQTKNQRTYQKTILDQQNQKLKLQQSKILSQLKSQKEYILNNIELFKGYNKRINEQISLNHLQIQSQNYNLIAECNLRKEQTASKKRALHQLIDSVKETQIYLDEMRKENGEPGRRPSRDKKMRKTTVEVPFDLFERQKQERSAQKPPVGLNNIFFTHFRPHSHKMHRTNIASEMSVKKLLDIRSLNQSEQKVGFRRIQTAKHKKEQKSQKQNWGVMKPLTATLKKRYARETLKSAISINKSSSKPSTCATYSRGKNSIAH